MPVRSAKLLALRASILLVAALIPATIFYPTIAEHAQATSLLLQLEDSKTRLPLADLGVYVVDESRSTIPSDKAPIPVRIYRPRFITSAPGMVIVHGVHYLGMDEPRLVAFARAIAARGIVVLTPELSDIADYKVTPASTDAIGFAAHDLSMRMGRPVGVLGLSFCGGLALIAAADPRFSSDIAFVVAVGAHDDMARVSRFLATGQIQKPDGKTITMLPHEYGALILVYSYLERFFAPGDIPTARDAIRLLLHEDVPGAKQKAAQLSPAGQERMNLLFGHQRESIRKELLAAIGADPERYAEVSPQGRMLHIRVPVLLLHGTGDEVIPATESLWLAQEIPQQYLRTVLISPAITHVEVGGEPSLLDKLALVHFIAEMLHEANVSARR
jgi:pimeloyl-ACP methyl ester carboxylesterase